MLVLAGMVTLSIIGAIAAIPSSMPLTIPASPPLPGLEETPPPDAEDRPLPSPGERPSRPPASAPGAPAAAIAAPPPAENSAKWLEAITYALLALVGLGALACLLLWRDLRRIAEELARARP